MNQEQLLDRLVGPHAVETYHVVRGGQKYWRAVVTLYTCSQGYADSVYASIQERMEDVDCTIMPGRVIPTSDEVKIRIEVNTPEQPDLRQKVQALIDTEAPHLFTADYRAIADPDELAEECLGTIISVWAEWAVEPILRVCQHALEDANRRSEAAVIAKMLVALRLSETVPTYQLTVHEED